MKDLKICRVKILLAHEKLLKNSEDEKMALMICPKCGKENMFDDSKICPECGFEIKNEENKKKRMLIFSLILGIVIAFIVLMAFFAILDSQKPKEEYDTEQLIEVYNYLSDNIGKMTFNDCKNYLKSNNLKYQTGKNGSIKTINIYGENNCSIDITIWDSRNLVGVSYGDNERTFYISTSSVRKDNPIEYEYFIYSGGSFSNEKTVETKQEQIEWLSNKLSSYSKK